MVGRGVIAICAAFSASACAVPREYMGIATRTPVPAEDRARINAVLASGEIRLPGCPWVDAAGTLMDVPCDLLPVSQLAGLAWATNRPAALELGIRFEEGRGVPRDIEKARKLYKIAATQTGGTLFVYMPKVGNTPGHVMPVETPIEYGLPEAQRRLAALPPKQPASSD